jgi:hypothetical protein
MGAHRYGLRTCRSEYDAVRVRPADELEGPIAVVVPVERHSRASTVERRRGCGEDESRRGRPDERRRAERHAQGRPGTRRPGNWPGLRRRWDRLRDTAARHVHADGSLDDQARSRRPDDRGGRQIELLRKSALFVELRGVQGLASAVDEHEPHGIRRDAHSGVGRCTQLDVDGAGDLKPGGVDVQRESAYRTELLSGLSRFVVARETEKEHAE